MPKTEVRSGQIKDATVGRSDVNTATAGEAVVAKIVAGTGISISSTGADTGTGDVTVTAAGGGAPAAHQTTHRSGGTDPVDVKLLAGYPGGTVNFLRGDGAFAAPTGVAPSLHKATHQDGGGDELALDGSQITTGTVTDARHSANVPLKNTNNTFSGAQVLSMAQPNVMLIDTSQPADARNFWLWNGSQTFVLQAVNDAGNVVHGQVNISRTGVVTAAGLGTTPLNATNITSGTLPDARLSGNVAKLSSHNTFTQRQSISATYGPYLYMLDTLGAANARTWRLLQYGDGILRLEAISDDEGSSTGQIYFTRTGGFNATGNLVMGGTINAGNISCTEVTSQNNFWEKGRTVPVGHWIDVPFHPSYFHAAGGGTWTVGAGTIVRNRYCLVGKMLHHSIYIAWWVPADNVVAGTVTGLNVVIPGITFASNQWGPMIGYGTSADMQACAANDYIQFVISRGGVAFAPGATPGFIYNSTWEIM